MSGTMVSGPCRRILFCTDFSANADFAFDFAVDAARRRPGCELFLLHVIPEPEAQFWKTYIYEVEDVDSKARRDIDAKIATAYLPRVPANVNLTVDVRIGRDSACILEFARERDVDLIVLGRQGHGALETVLFGNVAAKVARRAGCPVLVVPMDYKRRLDRRAAAAAAARAEGAADAEGEAHGD